MNKFLHQFYRSGVLVLCSLATTIPVQAEVTSNKLITPDISCQSKSLHAGAEKYYKGTLRLATPEEQIVAKIKSTNELETGDRLSGYQPVITAPLSGCGDCGPGLMWSGSGINRRCLSC